MLDFGLIISLHKNVSIFIFSRHAKSAKNKINLLNTFFG